ncbi:hypothetical protein [Streptomyces sp. NPDC059593]|uniref:hypothetical protein n=1 Tax=Streptomyces sp. NPDC059593 TaxID=3346878 RepID=UPI00368EEEAC
MSKALRRRLLRAQDAREKTRLEQQLTAAGIPGLFLDYSPPSWVTAERTRFFLATTQADFSTPPLAPAQLGQWLEMIASEMGMGTSLTAGTGLENFPWIRIETAKKGWGEILLEILGKNLTLVSENDTTLIVLFEEEYDHLAFTASSKSGSTE